MSIGTSGHRASGARRAGFALMLALWLIILLGTIAAGVTLATRGATDVAQNVRARTAATYAAESGITFAATELERALGRLGESPERFDYLDRLDAALPVSGEVALGDARFAVTLIDVNARLDVNNASVEQLTTFFSRFTLAAEAASIARSIRERIDPSAPRPVTNRGLGASPMGRAVGGGVAGPAPARLLTSLDELERMPGLPLAVLRAAAPYLTVDGDGRVNRATASDTVLAAAAGQLQDVPSRILIVSRGWLAGHPLTHEIQAVYAVDGARLALVRWRERDL